MRRRVGRLERLGYRFILDRGSQPDSEVLPRQRGTQEALHATRPFQSSYR